MVVVYTLVGKIEFFQYPIGRQIVRMGFGDYLIPMKFIDNKSHQSHGDF